MSYFVGPHVSIGGGAWHAPESAAGLGATGFGMFTKNQVQWHAAMFSEQDCRLFADELKKRRFTAKQVLPHAGYLINLANPDPDAHAKSMESLIHEMHRCAALGLHMLNLHPGSHLHKLSPEAALTRVAESINTALKQIQGVTVVIENTAGQGGCLGSTFEELAAIVRQVEDKSRIGVCVDTAHMFAAGFDIRALAGIARAFDAFDRHVGFKYLRGMHLNDSKTGLNSHVDRHESLGKGQIGWEPFEWIMRQSQFQGIPLVIETPDDTLWPDEIRHLLKIAGE